MNKIEALTKARDAAREIWVIAESELHTAEIFVEMAYDNEEIQELTRAKAEAYDARMSLDDAKQAYDNACEELDNECVVAFWQKENGAPPHEFPDAPKQGTSLYGLLEQAKGFVASRAGDWSAETESEKSDAKMYAEIHELLGEAQRKLDHPLLGIR